MHYDLICLVRCHKRAGRLARALHQLLEEVPTKAGCTTAVVIGYDRPSHSVQHVVERYSRHPNVIKALPIEPLMSAEGGQNWIPPLNVMMDEFDNAGHTATWAMDADDDRIMAPGWDEHFKAVLHVNDRIVCWREATLFVWGRAGGEPVVNWRQHHHSPRIYRYQTGDRRLRPMVYSHSDRIEDIIQEEPDRCAVLPFYMIDVGTFDPDERRALFRAYARAGKLDAYTKKYIEKPELMPLSRVLKLYPHPADFIEAQQSYILKGIPLGQK